MTEPRGDWFHHGTTSKKTALNAFSLGTRALASMWSDTWATTEYAQQLHNYLQTINCTYWSPKQQQWCLPNLNYVSYVFLGGEEELSSCFQRKVTWEQPVPTFLLPLKPGCFHGNRLFLNELFQMTFCTTNESFPTFQWVWLIPTGCWKQMDGYFLF